MSNYQIWQLEKYGNALPETECIEDVTENNKEALLPENLISQYLN